MWLVVLGIAAVVLLVIVISKVSASVLLRMTREPGDEAMPVPAPV